MNSRLMPETSCRLFKYARSRCYYGLIGLAIVKLSYFDAFSQQIFWTDVTCVENDRKYKPGDVLGHNSMDKRVWVSYLGHVYDITDFVECHPGGKIILQAAGKDLGPFFKKFAFHKEDQMIEILEPYLIGDLDDDDQPKSPPSEDFDEFQNEPTRDERLMVNSSRPFNSETPTDLLIENFYTPNEIFFVRNHMAVPKIDPSEHKITFCIDPRYLSGRDDEGFNKEIIQVDSNSRKQCWCKTFGFDDLIKNFVHHEIDATLQCTGNRRADMNRIKPVKGLDWKGGAIGNAKWKGIKLHDIFSQLGMTFDNKNAPLGHARFIGSDKSPMNEHYETSVPLRYALQPDTILAFEMNGQKLPPDHGYPIRVIIPGITGARNVKWLEKVIIVDKESQSIWQQEDYRCYSPNKNQIRRDSIDVPAIQEMPINSLICEPQNGETVTPELGGNTKTIPVKGYAFSGGDRGISRVEVSIDGGDSWLPAKFWPIQDTETPIYAWTFWSIDLPVSDTTEDIEIICKAVDTAYNHQPECALPIWNFRGLLNNSWHRIRIILKQN